MNLRDRLRRVEWPRALTLWGCADLFATGMGWAVTESHVLERVFWVTFPAVLIAFIVWMVALGMGDSEEDWEQLIASRDHRIAELERQRSHNFHDTTITPSPDPRLPLGWHHYDDRP